MADSNITKKALAQALKELMSEMPFEKINVTMICEKCNMNRKSFYYHFKDKYDLVNWIFDVEFISLLQGENLDDRFRVIGILCDFFYENRAFYRKALKINGQNSFSEHFRECLHPILQRRLKTMMPAPPHKELVINFLSDACVCALERWLSEKDCMPPAQFTDLLKRMLESSVISIYNELISTENLSLKGQDAGSGTLPGGAAPVAVPTAVPDAAPAAVSDAVPDASSKSSS